MFSKCNFYYYDTTFSAKAVYMRESGKTGSLNELKTLVKNDNFQTIKGEKMDLSGKDNTLKIIKCTQKSNKGSKHKRK